MAQANLTYDDPNSDPNKQPDPNAFADAAKKESAGFQPPPTPTSAWNREEFKNNWMSSGGQYGWNPSAYIAATPQFSQGVQALPGSNGDKYILPTGEVMDLSINYDPNSKTGSAAGWTGMGQWNGSSVVPYADAGGGGGAASGAASAAPASTASASLSASQQQDAALRQQLIDQLTARSQQSLAVDPNDPTMRAQTDAYSAEQERVKRNYLADVAEKSGPLANMAGETRLANERMGQATSGFQADLQGRELTARRAEIADALTSMRGMLSTEQQMNLQMQLAQMDDAIKRLSLDQSATQFNADLGYRNTALAQSGQQANNALGLSYDQFDWQRSPLNPANILPPAGS